MKSSIAFFSFCFLFLISSSSLNAEDFYKAVDKDGNVYITNTPSDLKLNYSHILTDTEKGAGERYAQEGERYTREGRADMQRKLYTSAANYFSRALEICKALNNVKCQSVAFNDMGNAFRAMGNTSQADAMYKQAAKVLTKP